ncbi:unnamed protein product [Schistocephalus solidus]|uniref:Tubulin-specific chaperone C n=1 Tax=Schistocephalus solidus TaxID=70667 RepID=A0A183SWJ7_SCHSO|nr:unnamed protein product [Schistocephalus solidus]
MDCQTGARAAESDGRTQLFERLAARDAARKAELLQKRRERQRQNGEMSNREITLPPLNFRPTASTTVVDSAPTNVNFMANTPANFLENLSRAKNDVLHRLSELGAADSRGDIQLPTPDKTKALDEILSQIEELQRWFSESSAHLKPFHIEQARLELDELKSKFQESREALFPKKKFAFGSKASKTNRKAPTVNTSHKSTVTTQKVTLEQHQHRIKLSEPPPKYSLSDLSDRPNLRLPARGEPEDALLGQSIYLSNLEHCVIYIEGVAGNLMAHGLRGCTVYAQPVASSILLQDCVDCHFVLACRQLRVHQTLNTRLDIFVASPPIIEDSMNLRLAPYPLGAAHSERFALALLTANLADISNHWCYVQDFSCPTLLPTEAAVNNLSSPDSAMVPNSPNWSLVPETEFIQVDIPRCPES